MDTVEEDYATEDVVTENPPTNFKGNEKKLIVPGPSCSKDG